MQWSDLPRDPSERLLRQFAGLWIAFFGGSAAWQWLRLGHVQTAWMLAAIAIAVGVAGLIAPRLVRPIFVGWMIAAFPIGWTVSKVALLFIFYAVLTPLGLLFRVMGRDVLQLRPQPNRTTYWTAKAQVTDVTTYFRQY